MSTSGCVSDIISLACMQPDWLMAAAGFPAFSPTGILPQNHVESCRHSPYRQTATKIREHKSNKSEKRKEKKTPRSAHNIYGGPRSFHLCPIANSPFLFLFLLAARAPHPHFLVRPSVQPSCSGGRTIVSWPFRRRTARPL